MAKSEELEKSQGSKIEKFKREIVELQKREHHCTTSIEEIRLLLENILNSENQSMDFQLSESKIALFVRISELINFT